MGVKKDPCTFTFPASLEMEMWDCCHENYATQLNNAAVAMQKATQLNHAAVATQKPHSLKIKHAAVAMHLISCSLNMQMLLT